MRHLLSIADLTRQDIESLMSVAESFAEVVDRDIKKVPTLRGRTIVNLFYESSTRTSSSFELAAKRLSADVVNIKSDGSAVDKGESLKDTIATSADSCPRSRAGSEAHDDRGRPAPRAEPSPAGPTTWARICRRRVRSASTCGSPSRTGSTRSSW